MQPGTLNQYLFPSNSILAQPGGKPAYKFGVSQNVQAKRIRASQVSFRTFSQLSANAIGTGGFANGSTLFLSSTLTPQSPIGSYANFAIPYIAIYQGTNIVSPDPHFQIYPTIGGSITPFQYTVQGHTDWHLYNGTNSAWGGAIQNNTGGSQNIVFITQWKWIQYIQGTVA